MKYLIPNPEHTIRSRLCPIFPYELPVLMVRRAAGVRPVLPDPSENSDEVGSWLPPRPEEQVGRAPGGAALRGGVGGKGEAATPIQVRLFCLSIPFRGV